MDNTTAVADAPSVYFRCWTVRCKTEDCSMYLCLDVIGPQDRALHAVKPLCKPFTIGCSECGVEHLYRQSDLEEHNLENPLRGVCKPFRDALAAAAQELKEKSRS
jgi:hypothetical protein